MTTYDDTASKAWRPATQSVRGGTWRSDFNETSEGLFMTSGYVYDSAEQAQRAFKGEESVFMYSRYANPTVAMFEKRLALIEGAAFCFGTSSGMAAVFASLASQLGNGSRIVAARALFGSCHFVVTEILPRFGVTAELVDGTDLAQWEKALSRKADAVFLESPSNPTLEIIDLAAVAELSHAAGAKLVVDNVFASPILQKPLELGADIVVYSATKHIDGQGRAMGGAVLTDDEDFYANKLIPFVRHSGPALSPFNAWVLLKGLETLDLRVRQHCANAHEVAGHLAATKGITRTIYPGLPNHPQYDLAKKQMGDSGNIVAFEIAGGRGNAFKFLNALALIDISNNLGDSKSLITHPATTTHQRLSPEERAAMGITDSLVRLSVGLEDPEDLKDDIDQALKKAR
ncbi:MAG: O-succinylhomoserine sulfhydrylase [Rhodospirillales bacterium]